MFNLMPKDPAFYDQLQRLSEISVTAAKRLATAVDNWPNFDGSVERIEQDRHEAHRLQRETLRRLDAAFITPFDREDILQIANELYSVVETIASAAQRFRLYDLRDLHPSLRGQVNALRGVTGAVHSVIEEFPRDSSLSHLRSRLDEIGRLEEQARADHAQFLAELYQGNPDPLEVMKKRELEQLIELAIRACDELGRTMERVLLKND